MTSTVELGARTFGSWFRDKLEKNCFVSHENKSKPSKIARSFDMLRCKWWLEEALEVEAHKIEHAVPKFRTIFHVKI